MLRTLFGRLSLCAFVAVSATAVFAKNAKSEMAHCDLSKSKDALSHLEDRLSFRPPFIYCFDTLPGETEHFYIVFDPRDLAMSKDQEIVAECDSDCGDIDLIVYDEQGTLLGIDSSPDSLASIRINDIYVGQEVKVEVKMSHCVQDSCGIALATTPVE